MLKLVTKVQNNRTFEGIWKFNCNVIESVKNFVNIYSTEIWLML